MTKEMLIHDQENDVQIALVEDRRLVEVYLPNPSREQLLGNIYLGKVENVLPGMQAAFVNIGLEKNSFLYVEDALPTGLPLVTAPQEQEVGEKRIDELVRKNQQVVVQIFKEPAGTKGARVTMQPSLPGRYLVLLPCGDYVAVSRRIVDETERDRLKALVREELPANMGAIVRTVAEKASRELLAADLRLLLKEWRRIQGRAAKSDAPALLHHDIGLLDRVIRDTNPRDIDRILVGSEDAFERVGGVIDLIAPALREKLMLNESDDLFLDYDIYNQMEQALARKVWLKSGGYIIIDQMEALTSIDVNTGKYVGERNLNDTVLRTNLEAVTEIARQLRLRNIGGIVIIDFIDLDNAADKDRLLAALEEEMAKDRVRVTVMGMTQLGLVELTRKKVGHNLSSVIEVDCPYCGGRGKRLRFGHGLRERDGQKENSRDAGKKAGER